MRSHGINALEENINDLNLSYLSESASSSHISAYIENKFSVFLLTENLYNSKILQTHIENAFLDNKIVVGFKVFGKDFLPPIPKLEYIDATEDYKAGLDNLVKFIYDNFIKEPYVSDEAAEKSFDIGKVKFRLGNLFDEKIQQDCKVLFVPVSVEGSVTGYFNEKVKAFNPSPVPVHPLGSISLQEIRTDAVNITLGYAYTVSEGRSDYTAISEICKNIIDAFKTKVPGFIHVPLFATASAGLNPIQVATIYVEHFNKKENSNSILVSILESKLFDSIQKELTSRQSATASNPDIKSRLHSDSFDLHDADVLNYNLIAENLFSILTAPDTNPPLNIAIIAPWGRGKTSLMKKLQDKFDNKRKKILHDIYKEVKTEAPRLNTLKKWLKNPFDVCYNIPYATVWFNPWNYQSSDMIWAGLADAVITQVVDQIPGKIDREIFWFQLRLARMDKDEIRKDIQTRSVLLFASGILWIVSALLFLILWSVNIKSIPLQLLCTTATISSVFTTITSFIKPYSKKISEAFEKYSKSPKYNEKTGTFHEVQTDLNRVLDLCIDAKKPLIIFIDDLDRCSPAKVVEVVEAINVFINGQYNFKCYFILGMDAEMVAAALDVSYEKMKGKMGSKELEQGSVGWYFLDKFIQLPFFIPVISESKKQEYLKNLLDETITSEDENRKEINTKKVDNLVSTVISTNDNAESSKAIKEASLNKEEELDFKKKILDNQINLQKQNEEINKQVSLYARFINSDPRSLKRFANLLRFYSSYQFLRMKEGQNYVKIKVLAKWLAIMLKFPQLIRWIQWDAENQSGMNNVAEEKVKMFDDLLDGYIKTHTNDIKNYNKWLDTDCKLSGNGKKIKDMEDMPWLKSQKLFEILMNESSEEAKFINALLCNVW